MRGRDAVLVTVAAAAAGVLALAQVVVAEAIGMTTLGGDFAAGAERSLGVQLTLISWYGGIAVPVAVVVAGVVTGARPKQQRWLAVPAAVLGSLAFIPFVQAQAGLIIGENLPGVIEAEVVLGVVAGLLATVHKGIVGAGIAAHHALIWLMTLVFVAIAPDTYMYAGVVEPLNARILSPLTGLNHLIRLQGGFYRVSHFHLAWVAPTAALVVLFSGVLAGLAVRRTGEIWPGIAAGVAGPALAAFVYLLNTKIATLWNLDGEYLAGGTAVLALAAAAAGAAVGRWRFNRIQARTAPMGSPVH